MPSKFVVSLALVMSLNALVVKAEQVSLSFNNLKGMGCYSTAPVGCSEDKLLNPLTATLFKNAKGDKKLLMGSMEYESVPSPSKDALIFLGLDANPEKGWAVLELVSIDVKNRKVSIVGTRSTSVFEKPIYQLMGDLSFE
ncbi:hypothetical protein [Thiomicrorhabdus sp. Kp2]|uniref:hypothetical protein n=1 Tax=Thiomicrorhabdus sp. Kp2 TaxID=1123518 RepID=UPI00041B6F8F|nr:hypothetical protein [Thiomicrorhabdus sp. Kp2]